MATTTDRELKLDVPEAFSLARLPELAGFTASALECRRLHTVYYDSADLRLARWGCSLRYREQEGWTLKLPAAEPGRAGHQEFTYPGTRAAVPGDALDMTAAFRRGAGVTPVAELRTLRYARKLSTQTGDALAEVVEDDVRVVAGRGVVRRFRQVEIELTAGAPGKALYALADALRREGAGAEDATPKYFQALGAAPAEPELPHVRIDATSNAGDVVRAALASSVERLIRHDAGVRRHDPVSVHQARVAVRRLRSDLQTFAGVLDAGATSRLRRQLKWLADSLGTARDADVLLERLRSRAAHLDAADAAQASHALVTFERERETAYGALLTAMRCERYATLLSDLVTAAREPPLNERAAEPASATVHEAMAAAWQDLSESVNAPGGAQSDADLHHIRIKAKRVRYAAESVGAVAGKPARRFARRMERLQTVLGEQHDAVVTQQRLREFAGNGAVAFVAGKLAMQEDEAARDGRTAWQRAWRKVSRKRRLFWSTPAAS